MPSRLLHGDDERIAFVHVAFECQFEVVEVVPVRRLPRVQVVGLSLQTEPFPAQVVQLESQVSRLRQLRPQLSLHLPSLRLFLLAWRERAALTHSCVRVGTPLGTPLGTPQRLEAPRVRLALRLRFLYSQLQLFAK